MAGSLRRNRNSIVWPAKSPKSHRRKSMLSQNQRTTILELHAQGVSKREIARVLKISRLSVRKVLRANSAEVPKLLRPEKAEPYRQQILELLDRDRKSTRLNSSHRCISYAVFCLKKKTVIHTAENDRAFPL